MSDTVTIQYIIKTHRLPDETQLTHWALSALPDNKHVTLRIVDSDEIQALNAQYRQKDKPTNVLSFPYDVPPGFEQETLGDVVLCAPIINAEATEQKKSREAHWAHIVIHGILHLCGFDHINDSDAEVMMQQEIALLNTLGFANPYEPELTE